MISFTITKTREIDEKVLFENLRDYLFESEIFDGEYLGIVEELPKDVQRLVFAKIGAMMIDYAGSEEF